MTSDLLEPCYYRTTCADSQRNPPCPSCAGFTRTEQDAILSVMATGTPDERSEAAVEAVFELRPHYTRTQAVDIVDRLEPMCVSSDAPSLGTSAMGTVGRLNSGRLVIVRRMTPYAVHLVSLPEGHSNGEHVFQGGRVFAKSRYTAIEVEDISGLSPLNQKWVAVSLTSHATTSLYRLRKGQTYPGASENEPIQFTDEQAKLMSEWFIQVGMDRRDVTPVPTPEAVRAAKELVREDRFLAPIEDMELIAPMGAVTFECVTMAGLAQARIPIYDAIKKYKTFERVLLETGMKEATLKWHIEAMMKAGQVR